MSVSFAAFIVSHGLGPLLVQFLESGVERVSANGSDAGLMPGGPGTATDRIEPERVGQDNGTVQTELCRDDAVGIRLFVNAAAAGGGELIALEDHFVDGIGEACALDPVENDIAHTNFAFQGLIAAFGVDNMGQPV